MKAEPYKNYKAANAVWLSALPETWEQIRGRFVMAVNPPARRARVLEPADEVSFVPMEAVGEYGGLDLERTKPLDEIGAGYTAFEEGDVVVAKITPCFENGKGAIARGLQNGVGFGTTELHVLRTGKRLDKQFLFYLTISHTFRMLGESEMYGAGGQKRVPPEFAKDFRIPLPPVDEQQTIASFLDAKTAQIDALVAQKQLLIAKLKEKRSALIARTVTRGLPPEAAKAAGLEPNPEMKDSRVDWLGPVPKVWEVIPLKWRARCSSGDGIATEDVEPNETTDSSIPVIGGNGLMGYAASSNIDHQVLVIGRVGALCGNVHIVTPPAWITDNALVLRPKARAFDNRYLAHVLRFRNLNDIAAKTAQPLITGTQVRDQRIPCPPMPEQTAMADFLDAECLKLDVLSCATETAIARLTEYRQALITSAVTGKIDVRELA